MSKTLITFDVSEDLNLAQILGKEVEEIASILDDGILTLESIAALLDGRLVGSGRREYADYISYGPLYVIVPRELTIEEKLELKRISTQIKIKSI